MRRPKRIGSVARARKLRANMSLPEVLLWRELRLQNDVKFRRQHPTGRYVLDFYCAERRFAIEIDGMAHDMGERPTRDDRRDAWPAEQGIEVVRIPAAEVLRSPLDVAGRFVRYCKRC